MKNTTMLDVTQRLQTQKTIQELILEFPDHTLQQGLPPGDFNSSVFWMNAFIVTFSRRCRG
jgi:hypothetical protein